MHRYKTPGTFTVALRFYNALGCYKETTQEIRVGKGYLVIFPSAFTPNEDGVNDLFQAKYTGITAFTLEIFDTLGLFVGLFDIFVPWLQLNAKRENRQSKIYLRKE